jgi:hypothetical protein
MQENNTFFFNKNIFWKICIFLYFLFFRWAGCQPTLSPGWAASPGGWQPRPIWAGLQPRRWAVSRVRPGARPGLCQAHAGSELIHSPHAKFAETMNSGKEDFRVWRMEYLFIPLGRGDRGDSSGR